MYENIGGKIKGLAKATFIVEAIAAVITGIILMVDNDDMIPFGLVLLIVGPAIAWASSWLLYGFGELIDKVCEIAKNTKTLRNTSAFANNQEYEEHIENSEKIATTFKSGGIMDIPKRNK